jgi:filamentous hemagglutinin family protein
VPNQNIRGIESDRIDGGAIRGSNLFHSFQEFNIDNGRGAYFSNPENISNILSRVTGNNLSNILGTLGVLGNANLFLINPNGIVFGPNARLDVGGSFFASTADGILFENGVEFAASNPDAPPLLTINIPIGLRLRENQPAIESSILLPPETVLLVGEDVNIVENTEVEPGSAGLISTNAGFLEGLSGNQNVIVQATNDITVRDLTDNVLEFQPGNGAIVFSTDVEGDGVGSFVMEDITVENPQALINNGADTLKTNGRDIAISGASLTIGNIDASGIDRSETPTDGAGQSLETAQVISNGSENEITVSGTISTPNDVDLFQIYITEENNFSAELGNESNLIFLLSLFDANGVRITSSFVSLSSSTAQNSSLSITPGIYYLAISRGIIGAYTINLTGVQAPEMQVIESGINTSDPGGVINLSATHGDINTANLLSRSLATDWGNAQNGGNIILNANQGNIVTGTIDSSSTVNFVGNSENGGDIALNAAGDITTGNLLSFSGSIGDSNIIPDVIIAKSFVSDGGEVQLQAGGSVSTPNIYSFSGHAVRSINFGDPVIRSSPLYYSITTQSGGNVNIEAGNHITVTDLVISKNGDINLSANSGGINIETGSLISYSFEDFFSIDLESGDINLSSVLGDIIIAEGNLLSGGFDSGNGGNITISTLSGNISIKDGELDSSGELAGGISIGFGGNVSLSTLSGDITTEGSILRTNAYNQGGNISFSTVSGNIIITNSNFIPGNSANRAGNLDLSTISGNISTIDSRFSLNSSAQSGNLNFSTVSGDIIADNSTLSSGNNTDQAGDINLISTSGNVIIRNSNFEAFAQSLSSDRPSMGGDINLSTISGNLILESSPLDASGIDRRGNINLRAGNDISVVNGLINIPGGGIDGNIEIISTEGMVTLEDLLITSDATAFEGSGGNFNISAQYINLINTDLSTTAFGTGNSGSIFITAPNSISLDFSRLSTSLEPEAVGQGGSVELQSDIISLANNSVIDAAIFGEGEAGNVTLSGDSVFLDNSSILNITGGESQAGDVTIFAEDSVVLSNRSNISTASTTPRSGDAGNINIDANLFTVTDGSQLQALTRGVGNAGQINLNVINSVTFSGIGTDGFLSGAFTSSSANNSGQGGDINISTNTLRIENGAVLTAQTSSPQPGGNIMVDAHRVELFNGGQLRTDTLSSGRAGNITVTAPEGTFITGIDPNFDLRPTPPSLIRDNVEIREPSAIAETESSANPQLLNNTDFSTAPVNTNPNVALSSRIPYISILGNISTETDTDVYAFEITTGTRGFFDVDTGSNPEAANTMLTLLAPQGNQLTSNSGASFSLGAEGSVPLNPSSSISRDPYVRFVFQEPGIYFIEVDSDNFDSGNYTLNISLESPNISGSIIEAEAASGMFARTSGTGAAGNITLNTPQLSVTDGAQISTTATATANRTEPSGNLTINADQINLSGNSGLSTNIPSSLSSETQGVAPAGTLILKPYTQPNLTVQLRNNAAISTSTSGEGAGGDLTITAPNTITLSGNGRIAAESSNLGQGGNIRIETETLRILEGIDITASSTGTGAAGSVEINSNFFELNNSNLSAETAEGDQGNITINVEDLRLRNNSSITTNAIEEATGGNISTINTETLTALENSDISANAEAAFGGRIIVNADGIFGTTFREQQSRFSDITATSELGPEFSGTVELNTELDPSSGLIDLSQTVVDPNDLIAQEFCRQRGESEFVVTGKGGIAADPNDKADGNQIEVDLVEPVPSRPRNSSQRRSETEDNQPISSLDLIPARGWIRDENGDVILVSYDPTKTGVQRQPSQLPQCQPNLNGEDGTRSRSVPSGENRIN